MDWAQGFRRWRRDARHERDLLRQARCIRRLWEVPAAHGGLSTAGGSVQSTTEGVAVTVVLGTRPDPQRRQQAGPDWSTYLRPWFNSIVKVGLNGVVLHDGLTPEVQRSYSSPRVTFCELVPGDWPLYHERHRMVLQYLQRIRARWVMVTDASDVAFRWNPFGLMERERGWSLFVGSEGKRVGQSRWLLDEMRDQFGQACHAERVLLNPGIIGGTHAAVCQLLTGVVADIEQHQHHLAMTDMSLFNKAVHDRYTPAEIFTGFPLHSQFKGWEFETRAAVMHK